MPLTSLERGIVGQFVALTGASDKVAQRFLKNTKYKLDVAVDQFYGSGQASQGTKVSDAALDKMFDELRDPEEDQDKDAIGVGSMMNYLNSLNVNPESCEIFVVLEIVQAKSFGQITRQGYVEGWKATGATPSPSSHKQLAQARIAQLSQDPVYFKRVYRHAFVAGKEPEQKALSVENALVYWEMLFCSPGRPWRSATADWLGIWKRFLIERWTHSVNRDMWNQTLEFANKTLDDPSLSFWSEDAAWPSVIDQFVLWCRENEAPRLAGSGRMEVD